jgi:hypothetical protein
MNNNIEQDKKVVAWSKRSSDVEQEQQNNNVEQEE